MGGDRAVEQSMAGGSGDLDEAVIRRARRLLGCAR
jgi:hypothetical protein